MKRNEPTLTIAHSNPEQDIELHLGGIEMSQEEIDDWEEEASLEHVRHKTRRTRPRAGQWN